MWKQDVDYMLTSVLTEIDSGNIYTFLLLKKLSSRTTQVVVKFIK